MSRKSNSELTTNRHEQETHQNTQKVESLVGQEEMWNAPTELGNSVGCLGMTQKIFATLFGDEAGVFQFEVSALDFAFVHA
jgi:hypothetical protein